MFRRALLLVIAGTALAADSGQQVFNLFTDIAAALSDDNPAVFVGALDPAMPHYAEIRNDVTGLTAIATVTNSIEVLSDSGDDKHRAEELDWFLEIAGKAPPQAVERRRAVLKFRLERRGRKWIIVAMDPFHFFAPPAQP